LDYDRRADGEISRLGRRLPAQSAARTRRWFYGVVRGRRQGCRRLACNADDDYELGARLIESGEPVPVPMPRWAPDAS